MKKILFGFVVFMLFCLTITNCFAGCTNKLINLRSGLLSKNQCILDRLDQEELSEFFDSGTEFWCQRWNRFDDRFTFVYESSMEFGYQQKGYEMAFSIFNMDTYDSYLVLIDRDKLIKKVEYVPNF